MSPIIFSIVFIVLRLQQVTSFVRNQYDDPFLQDLIELLPGSDFQTCNSPVPNDLEPLLHEPFLHEPLLHEPSTLPIGPKEKRDITKLGVFLSPAQIIQARLSACQETAKIIFACANWKTENKVRVGLLRKYFEQILFERWSRVIEDPVEVEALDTAMTNAFEHFQPVYKQVTVVPEAEQNEEYLSTVANLETLIHHFRLTLLQYLYKRHTVYRDQDLANTKQQLEKAVRRPRCRTVLQTLQTARLNLLIRAVFELLDWCNREYSSNQQHCYTNVQAALAARTHERIRTIHRAFLEIEYQKDMQSFAELVPKLHETAYEFFALGFPKNNFTAELSTSLKHIMERMSNFKYVGPHKQHVIPFEFIRSWSMHMKLIAVTARLKKFAPITSLPHCEYWKLLQVKIDLKNWQTEIRSWTSSNITATNKLLGLCYDGIKEVNRLKRTMDRLAQSRIHSDSDIDDDNAN